MPCPDAIETPCGPEPPPGAWSCRIGRRRLLAGAGAAALLGLAAPPARARVGAAGAEPLPAGAGPAGAAAGWLLVDPADGRVLAEQAADRPLIPASVTKLATVLAALALLGPGHRFETVVQAPGMQAAGQLRDGRLEGDLWLVGGGDPLLFGDDVQELVRQLHARGLRRVAGALRYDESRCGGAAQIHPRQPVAAPYNTGISALSVNFNRVELAWQRRRGRLEGAVCAVSDGVRQPAGWIGVVPLPASPGPGILYLPDGAAPAEGWLLSPALPERGTAWLPVHSPGFHTAMLFRALLGDAGAALPRPQPGTVPAGAAVLARHESEPLAAIAGQVLRFSNNLSAELLGLAAGCALAGAAVPPDRSAALLSRWWREQVPAVDWTGWAADTQSGLSAAGRATPRQIVGLLTAAAREAPRFGGTDLVDLLPPIPLDEGAAEDGDAAPSSPVRAKTGTLSYASALAGYLAPPGGGRRLAFAILMADLDRSAALDASFDPRVTATPPEARAWAARAREAQRMLVRRWLGSA